MTSAFDRHGWRPNLQTNLHSAFLPHSLTRLASISVPAKFNHLITDESKGYLVSSVQLNYTESLAYCEAEGGLLGTVTTAEQFTLVNGLGNQHMLRLANLAMSMFVSRGGVMKLKHAGSLYDSRHISSYMPSKAHTHTHY